MPRFSPQRLIRCALYACCALMAGHAVFMLAALGRATDSWAAGADSPARVGAAAAAAAAAAGDPISGDGAGAGGRRVASIKAIAPELLLRIGRPVPQLCSTGTPAGDDPVSVGFGCVSEADPAKLARPLLLSRVAAFNLSTWRGMGGAALAAAGELALPPLFSLDTGNATDIQAAMVQINADQDVLNSELYTSAISEAIVVQVHDRIEYLYLLIDSLRRAKDIEDCLLVFSHDVYSPAINALVRSIRFARVLQVFYPYSKQIYPDRFPGTDARDCPRDAGKSQAKQLGCLNADSPDAYGHYREAKYAQTKHHWLYKMHFVFERARPLANYTGQVVFLEEDHYVVEDFLHVLRLMDDARQSLYKDVEILTLATYEKKPDFSRDTAQTVVDKWVSSFHNMGMVFARSIWERIRPCLRSFCDFDDYNWDWSLNHILNSCAQRPFQTMVIRISPRVFHIGECGVHHTKKVCNPALLTSKLDKMLADNIAHLYPERLTFNAKLKIRARTLKPNGGWGDRRDRELCVSFFNSSQSPPSGLPRGF